MWRRIGALVRGIAAALGDAWSSFRRHRGALLGAGLAFYTLLSLAPLLVVGVAIAGFVLGEGEARAQALGGVYDLLGPRGAAEVGAWMDTARAAASEATLIGALLFLYGASRMFVQLESALDAVWDAPVKEHETLVDAARHIARQRLKSFLLMLGFGLVIAGSLVLQIVVEFVLEALLQAAGGAGSTAAALLRAAHLVFSLGVLTTGFALAFRRAPHRDVELRDTWLGAFVTAMLFSFGNSLLGLYVGHIDVGAAYGVAGSIVAVLVWLVFAGQIVLYGAELTRVVATRARSGPSGDEEPGIDRAGMVRWPTPTRSA